MKNAVIAICLTIIAGAAGYFYLAAPNAAPPPASASTPAVRPWSSLSDAEKDRFRIEAYALFPEILDYSGNKKFDRLNQWMAQEKGITHPNIRDVFRLREDQPVSWQGQDYKLPGVYATLLQDAPKIREYLGDRTSAWLESATAYADFENVDIDAMIRDSFAQP